LAKSAGKTSFISDACAQIPCAIGTGNKFGRTGNEFSRIRGKQGISAGVEDRRNSTLNPSKHNLRASCDCTQDPDIPGGKVLLLAYAGDRFAQKAGFAGRFGERVVSDPLLPFAVREESANSGRPRNKLRTGQFNPLRTFVATHLLPVRLERRSAGTSSIPRWEEREFEKQSRIR
jgi:hypothetical protein